ncbi:AraC family transcriptional regulator [Streptomyces sp. Y2F8-2]|uniref:helix-turn-helix domain-containing protein n=1 Tax=Streptomyces sp. Y2F8-2 TaxID=2759675 RepID=UPI00190585AD|nr:helix-turn-helix domain-containing protein [Streptomyces sp. Y2F8-2]GHK01487.1 AraC family transcriptional regulator [Streptomyces sp. Y2F8-2]
MSALPGTPASPGTGTSTDVGAAVSRWLAPVLEHTRQDAPASGSVTLHHFGYVRLVACEALELRLSRGPRSIAQDASEAVALLAPRNGTVRLAQDGRGAHVESGQLALIDLRRPFSVEHRDHARMLFFRVPVHALHLHAALLRSVTARALTPKGGVAALLPLVLRHLEKSAARTPPAVAEGFGGIVTELVAALVEELTEEAEAETPRTGRHQLVVTIRQYIDRHLDDPELSAERIAGAHLISVRYLHRLFEGEGVTVGRLILRRRVEECARELARRGRVSPSISVVAARWGFRNAAHFSRAFKAVHGHSPQQWRRLAGAAAADTTATAGGETARERGPDCAVAAPARPSRAS